jgi:hypothetical protein
MATMKSLFEGVNRASDLGVGIEVTQHGVRIFAVDACEVCGTPVEGAEGTGSLTFAGLTPRQAVEGFEGLGAQVLCLDEIGHCDALGLAVCPDCYVDEEDDDDA